MDHKIKISQPQNDNFGQSLSKLLLTLESIPQDIASGDQIFLDISSIEFVYPLLILPLASYSDRQNENGINTTFTPGLCQEYLKKIYFPKGFNPLYIAEWQKEL